MITLEFDEDDAKVAHIEHLQKKLTERNEKIAVLEERLAGWDADNAHYQRGLKDGREQALSQILSEMDTFARSLGKLRKEALKVYWESQG